MKVMKFACLTALVMGLLASTPREAAAQAPTLTSTVNGASVRLEWTSIAGATLYNLVVTGTLSGQFLLPTNFVQVTAPAGTYTVQVQAVFGSTPGPLSAPLTVTVGGAPTPCTGAPSAPVLTATANGAFVNLAWSGVPGATGYLVQFSRFPGGTEISQTAGPSATTFSQFVGLVGTFYVRLVVVSPCGNAVSAEVAFTIASLSSGAGPRTPDPAPGQLLPKPTYGESVVAAMAAAFPGDLANSCAARGGNHVFMYRVLSGLRQRDSRWGLNIKRGNQGLSEDIVTYNPTAGPDEGATNIYLWDMIGNHCPISGSARWNWEDVTQATRNAGARGECANRDCAYWTIVDYLRAGFQP